MSYPVWAGGATAAPPVLGLWAAPEPPAAAHPRPSSLASWAFGLSVVAMALAPMFAGIVPALFALLLTRAARPELLASEGWLLGDRTLGRARVLSWCAIGIAAAVGVLLIVAWLVGFGEHIISPVYPSNVN